MSFDLRPERRARRTVGRSGRRGVAIAVAATAALLATGAGSARGAPPNVAFGYGFTTHEPGTTTGRLFFDEFTDPDDPQAKPQPITHVHFQMPPGTRIDTGAIPQCGASDVELMVMGPDACPAGSKVGGEVLRIDTGLPGDARFLLTDVTFLNNRDQIIFVSRDRMTGARVVSRGTVARDSEDADFPALPGTPPDGGAVKREEGSFGVTGAYTTTPATCPASGAWTFTGTWTFKDGSTRTVASTYPCTPTQTSRPGQAPIRAPGRRRSSKRAHRRHHSRRPAHTRHATRAPRFTG